MMRTFYMIVKKKILYGLAIFLGLSLFIGGISNAANDLLWQAMKPSVDNDTIIKLGENVTTVGNNVFKGSFEVGNDGVGNSPSVIVLITRVLLILTIALSITMILYNGMMYIIETGKGKEGKSLIKNVGLIVVGILISLFSVVAINLLQSIPATLEEELPKTQNNKTDLNILKEKRLSWKDIRKKILHKDDEDEEYNDANYNNLVNEAKQYFSNKEGVELYTVEKDGKDVRVIKEENGDEIDVVSAYLDMF